LCRAYFIVGRFSGEEGKSTAKDAKVRRGGKSTFALPAVPDIFCWKLYHKVRKASLFRVAWAILGVFSGEWK
jgi:hypothetical protein